jgi:hypothetical protein
VGTEVRIVNADGRPLPNSALGEIVCAGRSRRSPSTARQC